jgi:hypothetical protein
MAAGKIAAPLFALMPGLSPATTNLAAQGFMLGETPERNAGYVTNHAFVPIWLWNGSPDNVALISITGDAGSEGIVWDVELPAVIAAKRSLRVVLDVTAEGPPQFDGLLTFVTSRGPIALRLYGTRRPQLPADTGYLFFPHNWEDGLTESLAWKTDVMIAHDRSEQRVQLRTMPRRSWDLRLLVAGDGRRKLETWLSLRQTRELFMPVWRDESRLNAPITAGEAVAYLDSPQLLDFAIGRWLAVYDAWNHFEIREVKGIGNGYVAVDAPFTENWPAGGLVAPCRYGLALDTRRVTRFTEDAGDYSVHFEAVNESVMPVMQGPEMYHSAPVCPFAPSWDDDEESIDNKWVRLDNDTGVIEFAIQSLEPVLSRQGRFFLTRRSDIDLFLRFLFYCAGRLAPFWLAATDRGFELAAPALAGAQAIIIGNIVYEQGLFGSAAKTDIEMITTDGRLIRRRIISVVTLPTGHEQLNLDSPLDFDVSAASLNRCAWLQQCRLNSDEISLKWWGGDCLEATLPIMVLP